MGNRPGLQKLGFVKKAGLSLEDIEGDIGTTLSDRQEPTVRRLISEQYQKRTALRHPVATGIPTLGIAPAIAKHRAKKEVKNKLLNIAAKTGQKNHTILKRDFIRLARQHYDKNHGIM